MLRTSFYKTKVVFLRFQYMKSLIDPYKRYQKGLVVEDIFPTRQDRRCACGCGRILTGRKAKWFSKECMKKALIQFFIIKGDTSVIRSELFKRDKGFCQICGVYDEKWQADHIKSVSEGGSACSLYNFQTLCNDCHKIKTSLLYRIPNSDNVLAPSFDIFEFCLNPNRTLHECIRKNIIRNTICVPYCIPIWCLNKI